VVGVERKNYFTDENPVRSCFTFRPRIHIKWHQRACTNEVSSIVVVASNLTADRVALEIRRDRRIPDDTSTALRHRRTGQMCKLIAEYNCKNDKL
jgi:hypothetical protein